MPDAPRTALVSGGNRGIGLEACRQLGRLGHRVLLGSRDADKGERVAAALRGDGHDVTAVPLDVTDPACVARLARERPDVDILVNNAGVYLEKGTPSLELDDAMMLATLDANTMGPFRLARAFLPGMAGRGWGRVASVSSGMGQLGDMGAGSLAYRVSKTALNALTVVLAREVEGKGVKVNAACPGWVRTDMGGPRASSTVEQGADTVVWLATLPNDGPTGGFFRGRRPIPW